MFDRFTAKRNRPSGKRVLAIGSALIHLVLGGLLVAMGFWEISEIGRPNRGVAMATTSMPSSGGAAEKPAGKRVERAKKLVKDTRQPSDRPKDEVETGGGETSATGTGEQGGDPNALGDGPPGLGLGSIPCLDPARCGGDMPAVAKPPKPDEVKLMPSTVLGELVRVAGDPQIQPPTSTQNAMRQQGSQRVHAVIKMCLSKSGSLAKAGVVKSSGFSEYDAKLLSKMRAWRYRPYRASGNAIAICTHVTFIYKQE